MIPARIEGANVCFKRPEGSTADQCGDLYVRREVIGVGNAREPWMHMTSAWTPTPAEIARINAGASVHLSIAGTAQPPVMLTVGEPPESLPVKDPEANVASSEFLALAAVLAELEVAFSRGETPEAFRPALEKYNAYRRATGR